MFEKFALVISVLITYATVFVSIALAIALLYGILAKLYSEPGTVAKLLFVALIPFVLAFTVPYYILYQELGTPFWLNLIVGFAIYAFATDFLEKRVKVRFKDDETNS